MHMRLILELCRTLGGTDKYSNRTGLCFLFVLPFLLCNLRWMATVVSQKLVYMIVLKILPQFLTAQSTQLCSVELVMFWALPCYSTMRQTAPHIMLACLARLASLARLRYGCLPLHELLTVGSRPWDNDNRISE